jgi:hypothetical protein
MEKVTFKQLTGNFIYYQLGCNRIYKSPILTEWIKISENQIIPEDEEKMLKRLQHTLIERSTDWNEFELSEWFIGPVLTLIDFNTRKFKLFAFRDLVAVVKDYELSGRPDVLIASGLSSPITPYFCFHEYKRQTDPEGNPQAQLIGAMLAAQALNNNEKPLYGIYVVGYDWKFVVLQGNEWCESRAYHADDEELFDIFRMLKALKEIILSYE